MSGGGIGGLVAAISLAKNGVQTTVVERNADFNIPGVGLGQPANALRVYRELGLLEDILDRGFSYNHMSVFDDQRNLLVEHKFLLGDDTLPAVCAISRNELHSLLLHRALSLGVELKMNEQIQEISDEADKVHIQFQSGSHSEFDILLGFDGIRSTVRNHLFGNDFRPEPSGYGAWRIQVPRPPEVTGMEFLQGVRGKTGVIPLAQDLMYLFHICAEPIDERIDRAQYASLLQQKLQPYGSYVREIQESLTEESDIVYSPLEPMLIPWPWHKGRIVLGGDAAHVFPPHLTQGAAMAAEDGYVLAHCLTQTAGTLEEKLSRYYELRFGRCAFVYHFAKQWLQEEQSVHSHEQYQQKNAEYRTHLANRIASSDRILNREAWD